jgi:hypothetical protein
LSGLVANDDHGLARLQWLTGAGDLFDERASTGAVQHFGQAGLETGTFSRSEDYDG